MIIALVQIPRADLMEPSPDITARYADSTSIFREVPGLRRKYFLNGGDGGGGVYEFATRAEAEAWFHDGWADWMEGRFGVRPTLTLFECRVMLDNEAGEVRIEPDIEAQPA